MKTLTMKRSASLLLRIVIYLLGLWALGMCLFVFPYVAIQDARAHPDSWYVAILFLLGVYSTATPFFIGLYQGVKLLNNFDKNQIFTEGSVKSVSIIKYCALAIIVIVLIGLTTLVLNSAPDEDIVGFYTISFLVVFASTVVIAVAVVSEKLLQNAVDLKSENELTV